MKIISPIISAASGRLGDMIASRNRGGMYLKAYVVPTDPMTAEQLSLRAAMAAAVAAWSALTDDQRQAWNAYSNATPREKKLGRSSPSGALPEFIRANVPRLHADNWLSTSLGTVSAPPNSGTAYDPTPTPFLSDDAASLVLCYPTDSAWLNVTGSAMLVWVSPPKAATINYFRQPNTLVEALLGATP